MKDLNNIKKYLPSRKFNIILGGFLFLAIVIVAFSYFLGSKQSFLTNEKSSPLSSIEGKTINEIINTDSDLDSVYDWEETLWGTDKNKQATFDNIPDSTYIAKKKKELNIEQEQDNKKLTETEIFARNFFTAYTALKATGEVSSEEINEFSASLGEKISDDNLPDKYSANDIKIAKTDDSKSRIAYYNELKIQFEKYETQGGLGEEINIISTNIAEYQNTKIEKDYLELTKIGNAYIEFAKSTINISVPESLKTYHLKIANSSHNTGVSLADMSKAVVDPIIGIGGLSKYQRYSKEFIDTVELLETLIK